MPEVIHSDHSLPDARPITPLETEAALLALPIGTLFLPFSSFRTYTSNGQRLAERTFYVYIVVADTNTRHRFAEIYADRGRYTEPGNAAFHYSVNDFPRNWKFTILRYGADGEEYYA